MKRLLLCLLVTLLAVSCGGSGGGIGTSPSSQPSNQTVSGSVGIFGTTSHSVTVTRSGTMRITLSWTGGADLDLYLTNPSCSEFNLASCTALGTSNGFVNPEVVTRTVTSGEQFKVFVDNNSAALSANYTVTINVQ